MRLLANLLLIFFPLTGLLDLAGNLLESSWSGSLLVGLGQLCSLFTLLLAGFVYLGFAVNRHLPWRIFLPLLLFLLWRLLDFWPLLPLVGRDNYQQLGSVFQLLLGLALLHFNRCDNPAREMLFTQGRLAGSSFSAAHFWRFVLVNLLVLPILLLIFGYAIADRLIEGATAGFVKLQPNGLYMLEKTYRRDAKTIHLAAMIHLGQQSYYTDLLTSFAGKNALILAEGVSDRQGLLTGNFSYGKLADLLGLKSQEQLDFNARLISPAELENDQSPPPGTAIMPADVDLSEFDPRSIAVIDALGRTLLGSDDLGQGYREFNAWADQQVTPETSEALMADLLERRNAKVLSYLPAALGKYDQVLIPWGALHMPGLETEIRTRGFRAEDTRLRLSIDFLRLPYQRLWQTKTAKN